MKEIKQLINKFPDFCTLKEKLHTDYGLIVKEGLISGDKVMYVKRDEDVQSIDSVQDCASTLIITENMELISAALPKMYDMNSSFGFSKKALELEKEITVEEWFSGKHVVVSLHKHSFIISTEHSKKASDLIPHTHISYYNFILDEMDRINPYKALDMLSEEDPDLIWIFNVSPINSEFNLIIDNEIKHELILISCIKKSTVCEIDKKSLEDLGKKLGIKTPKYYTVSNKKEFDDAVDLIQLFNNNIKGVVCRSAFDTTWIDKYELNEGNGVEFVYSQGKHTLYKIAKMIIDGDWINAMREHSSLLSLVVSISTCFDKYVEEINLIHNKYNKSRTRKRYAEYVSKHQFSYILFKYRHKDSIDITDISKCISPKKLINTIKTIDEKKLKRAIKNCKGNLCQKK